MKEPIKMRLRFSLHAMRGTGRDIKISRKQVCTKKFDYDKTWTFLPLDFQIEFIHFFLAKNVYILAQNQLLYQDNKFHK